MLQVARHEAEMNGQTGERGMEGLPPLENSNPQAARGQRSPKKVLRFKEDEELALSQRSRPSRLPNLHRRSSLLAYDPIIVRFLKNGDRFFEGVKVNISQRNMRSWDVLLAELSRRIELPAGVRQVYTPERGHRVKSLSQLEHHSTYVCGSSEPFKKIDYDTVKTPEWRALGKMRFSDAGTQSVFSKKFPLSPLDPDASLDASSRSFTGLTRKRSEPSLDSSMRKRKIFQKQKPLSLTAISESKSPRHANDPLIKSPLLPPPAGASRHVMLTVIRNGPLPRENTIVYIDKAAIKSWEEARQLISDNLGTTNGYLRLFQLDGEEVQGVSQLWRAGNTLIAAGNEKFDIVEFLMGSGSRAAPEVTHSPQEDRQTESEKQNTNTLEDKGADELSSEASNHPLLPESSKESKEKEYSGSLTSNSSDHELKVEKESDAEERFDPHGSKSAVGEYDEPSLTSKETMPTVISGIQDGAGNETSTEEQTTSGNSELQLINDRDNKHLADFEEEVTPSLTPPRQPSSPHGSALSSCPAFPPTPTLESSPFGRRPRLRKFSGLFEETESGSSSHLGSPLLHAKHKSPLHRGFQSGPLLHPQTPQSEISMGMVQSMVDMIMPTRELQFPQSDDSCFSNLSSDSSDKLKSRTVGIQTTYTDDHLSTVVEPEEVFEEQSKSERNDLDHTASQTDMTLQDLDASAAASQLHKLTKEKYHVGMVIAEGSFAAVKHCSRKQENKELLLRVIQKHRVFGRDDKILEERDIMQMIRHENILAVLDYWESSDELCLVMEPIEGGDLFDAILHCQHFSEADALEATRQLGLALVYLHANSIVHRGVKPENIFLSLESDSTWTLKLAGFSLATRVYEPLSLVCGNEYYRAPEMISGKGYGTKVDVWSAGVITYILLSGTMPFRRRKSSHASVSGKFSFPITYWDKVTNDAKDFVRRLLVVSPQLRYSSSHLMQHSWLKKSYGVFGNSELSKKLIEYLNNKAALRVAPVPILTVTALDHESHGTKKNNRSRKQRTNQDISNHP